MPAATQNGRSRAAKRTATKLRLAAFFLLAGLVVFRNELCFRIYGTSPTHGGALSFAAYMHYMQVEAYLPLFSLTLSLGAVVLGGYIIRRDVASQSQPDSVVANLLFVAVAFGVLALGYLVVVGLLFSGGGMLG